MESPNVPEPTLPPAPVEPPRRPIAAFVGTAVVSFLVGGLVVWILAMPSKSDAPVLTDSGAAVLEVARPDGNVSSDVPGVSGPVVDAVWQREILGHAAAIKHRANIELALKGPDVRGTKWYGHFSSADLADLSFTRGVRVRAVPGTALIEVSVVTGASAQEQATLANALVNTYLEQQRQRRTMVLLDRTQMLNTIRIRAESRMRDLENEIRQLIPRLEADRIRNASPATSKPIDAVVSDRQEMALQEETLARLREEQQQLRQQLKDAKERIEQIMALSSSQYQSPVQLRNRASAR
jgi:hypothetical protein